ncbi:hypothetical protein BBO99_00007977 [Phytophthora kernoviae]|uniref:SWIM-type domain-containing protein n=2 Tax=Phytophthora kernoviae TaxID=325452 RepID=A0A3R7J3N5_9STRA|nr:hypothetical protein G195_006070 [Phytophthora kernoviae 00238/432]KAG2526515.1 hypothetical protein JM18_004357 [Phytophthora kernoviae]KAG2530566.1 hypothetical protein JM16_000858 [Phytophthora kernoviae]RLN14736.1 hypothetical protein BBI17_007928 [Phytophthora kernoviae]RLN75881.1 hypothetical protein BBO99_00007977 [Phytophthora kernoviae]
MARKAHCEKTRTMYVCRNTVKVAVANKRRKLQVPDNWVYDRKVYVCTHGYKRVSRSSGSRPRQHVRYTECKARFTACVVSEQSNNGHETLLIKITGQHVVHSDHPVSLEQWRMYSQNRAAVGEHPYLTHEAELMRRVGSNKRAARTHIENLSGKVCTMKDMHNLYARLKKREGAVRSVDAERDQSQRTVNTADMPGAHSRAQQPDSAGEVRVESILQRFVGADVENHASILSGDDGSNEAICVASRAMKEHFQVFPELLLLDVSATKLVDGQSRQHLHGFLSMDALGNAKPIFVAQSLTTSPALLHRICQDFKRTHPKWVRIKKLIMDKLLPEVVQRDRTRSLPQDRINGNTLDYEEIRQLLQQLVFARSESRGDGGDPLVKGVSEVLSMIQFIGDEWTSKMLILELTKPVVSSRCDPLMHFMVNCLSSFAVDLICSQLTTQSAFADGSVAITKSRAPRAQESNTFPEDNEELASPLSSMTEVTVRWINKTTREKHILQRDGSACDCEYFTLFHLPCRHLIRYEVSVLQHKQLSMAAVGPRWFLRSFQTPKLASQRESNEIEYHLL